MSPSAVGSVLNCLASPLTGNSLQPTSNRLHESFINATRLSIDVSSVWPLAFETGRWEGHLGSEQGPVVIGGRYSAQWVKRGDRWLIRSEVFVALEGSGTGLQMKAVP